MSGSLGPARSWPAPERLGAFDEAARRFVPSGPRPPLGAEGVRFLLEELRRAEARADASAGAARVGVSASFMEAAGAFLAVLLIDAHGGQHAARRGQHRVLVGRGGSVDPFAIVEGVLDADAPAQALATSLRRAEDEAADRSAPARAVAAFLDGLARIGFDPERVVVARFDRVLELDLPGGRVEVDLERLVPLADDPAALERGATRVLGLLPGVRLEHAPRALHWEEAAPRLVPRILGPASKVPRDELYLRPLPFAPEGTLGLGLQLHYPGRARFLRADEVADLGEERSLLRAGANLAASTVGARLTELIPGLWAARSAEGVAASWVLLPSFGARLRALLGSAVQVAVPHRDLLLAASADVSELGPIAAREAAKAPHAISPQPFALGEAPLDVGLVSTPQGLGNQRSLPPAPRPAAPFERETETVAAAVRPPGVARKKR